MSAVIKGRSQSIVDETEYSGKLTGKEFQTAIGIAWPAVMESFFLSFAGMIDILMVSALGSTAVASVGLTTQPKFFGLAAFFAMNIAVSALVARRRGQKDQEGANSILVTALFMVMVIGIILTVILHVNADRIMHFCGSNADTHQDAVTYFKIIMGGMLINAIAMCINAAQRGAGNTRISMVSNTVSSVVNIIGNYLLIEGHLGFPALGITGAALATVNGTLWAMIISIISLFRKNTFLNIHLIISHKLYDIKLSIMQSILRLSSSSFVEQILMRTGFMATAVMAADMGTAAMAAHQVGMNCMSLSFSFGDGMQAAAVTLIGQSLGRKQKKQAKRYGWTCEILGLFLAFMMCLIYMFFSRSIFQLFFREEEIISIGVGISRIIMILVIFQICQVIFTGCLRGAGDVIFTMISACVCVTIIRTFVSWFCCYQLGWGIYGIWLGVLSDQAGRMTLGMMRFRSGKWMKISI